jgi:hypothetical protein
MATTAGGRPAYRKPSIDTVSKFLRFEARPTIKVDGTEFKLDERMPLHQLAIDRMKNDRDLKIIITARDSETGVGKTTCAAWLALNWTWMFSGQRWNADEFATLNPHEYFRLVPHVDPGTVLLVDDAEELDARRSMQDLNVKFSWWWELMRLKRLITIITLPSPASIDSRLEELADVWINILDRGSAIVHDIGVGDYDRELYQQQVHVMEFPDVSEHSALRALQSMKQDKMQKYEEEANAELGDEDAGLTKTSQTFLAVAQKERNDAPWTEVAELDDRLEYSGEFYRKKSKELLA